MRTPGTNWQLTLADLSIILFLTSFSALAQDRQATQKTRTSHARHAVPATSSVAIAEPVALWRAGGGAPPLAAWLKDQGADSRMRVNVVGVYGAGDRDSMLAQATALSADPALSGRAIRLILEPAAHSSLTVTLSYDQG
jgi:hypothetical protein